LGESYETLSNPFLYFIGITYNGARHLIDAGLLATALFCTETSIKSKPLEAKLRYSDNLGNGYGQCQCP
jgi:hypothetical protein